MAGGKKWIGYYGDDFTGSTDAMEALTMGGVKTVLFLRPPSAETLADERFADAKGFGIAGISRALNPQQMEVELRGAFEALRDSGAAICHYKTCSTFDSSPHVGSIGKAVDVACEVFDEQRYVPLVVGVPTLKRYTVFGNHFATVTGETYRLDRHPVMSRHPMTPMDEADLRVHLAKQTAKPIELVDVLALAGTTEEIRAVVDEKLEQQPSDIVLFDVLDDEMLRKIGEVIHAESMNGQVFAAGSSGIEYGLASAWRHTGRLAPDTVQFPQLGSAGPMLVVSGSCSMVTNSQIEYALSHGFAGVRVSGEKLVDPEQCEQARAEIVAEAEPYLAQGRSVVIYSATGPDDPSIDVIREKLLRLGRKATDTGKYLGEQLGKVCKEVIRKQAIKRAVIAGGDTSGYVIKELGIYAMEMIMPVVPGGPLCRTYSDDAQFDGLQLSLKGGQVGGQDYFVRVSLG